MVFSNFIPRSVPTKAASAVTRHTSTIWKVTSFSPVEAMRRISLTDTHSKISIVSSRAFPREYSLSTPHTELTDSMAPMAEMPGKMLRAPPNPMSSPSTRLIVRASLLPVGRKRGM